MHDLPLELLEMVLMWSFMTLYLSDYETDDYVYSTTDEGLPYITAKFRRAEHRSFTLLSSVCWSWYQTMTVTITNTCMAETPAEEPHPMSLHVWVYLHSNLFSGLQKTHLFCTGLRFGRSRSFRVIQGRWFWYQSKARIRLPISRSLWLWSYLAPFSRYVDLLAKNCLFLLHFPTPLSFGALPPYVPLGISRRS